MKYWLGTTPIQHLQSMWSIPSCLKIVLLLVQHLQSWGKPSSLTIPETTFCVLFTVMITVDRGSPTMIESVYITRLEKQVCIHKSASWFYLFRYRGHQTTVIQMKNMFRMYHSKTEKRWRYEHYTFFNVRIFQIFQSREWKSKIYEFTFEWNEWFYSMWRFWWLVLT